MGLEIILCDGEADTSTFASPENTRLSGLSRISDHRLKSNHQKANQCNVRGLLARRVLVSLLQDLGVFLDQCLSFEEHIRKTVASCMNKPIQINRISIFLIRKRFC